MMKKKYSLFLFFILFAAPFYAESEFYQYIDKNGVKHFTDDKAAIPETSLDEIVEHKDKYDYMTEDEKQAAKKKEATEAEKLRIKRRLELQAYREKAALRKKAEQLKKKLKTLKTRVIISNNQILVPVTLKYNGNSLTTTLLLDTGANSTVINDSIAAQLQINSGKNSLARVAGGAVVKTKLVKMDPIKVGPKTLEGTSIFVIRHKGSNERFHGLLGLDFLSRFSHTIDYNNQYICWKE